MKKLLEKIKWNKTVAIVLAGLVVYHAFLTSIYTVLEPYVVYMTIALCVIFMFYIYFGLKNRKSLGNGKVYTILAFMFLPIAGMSQEGTPEEFASGEIIAALKGVWEYINWAYIVIFMLISWLINDYSSAKNKAHWLDWLGKFPKWLATFVIGILLIAILGYFFHYNTREDYFALFFSLILGMVLYKIGPNKVFGFISSRWLGIKKE